MFCERCGTKIEAGERFCPSCGNRIETAQMPAAEAGYRPAMSMPTYSSGAGSLTIGGINPVSMVLGVLMLISTLMPFVNIKINKLAEGVSYLFGGSVADEISMFSKMNIYKIAGMSKELDLPTKYRVYIYLVIVFILATAIMAIVSGVLRKRTLNLVSGGLSSTCLLAGIVYMIYVGVKVSQANKEIAEMVGISFKLIKGVHGFGFIFLLLLLTIHVVYTFTKLNKN